MTKVQTGIRAIVTLSALGLAAASLSAAEPPRRGGGFRGPGLPLVEVFRQLELSDEQRDRVRSTVDEWMWGELGELLRTQRSERRELERLILDPSADEAAILAASAAVNRTRERVAVERHRFGVALFEILDETQRAEALALIAELPERGRRGYGGGPPRRGPAAGD
ncbi:MAG TPA: periplasmic heavy metal sensor [Candidatus Polarisedimenticolaceae bacterium]|nr:periplasmic heavy metal sensor [Candidatus Polarisedimenticolaceae bacterium]